jgi:hypothetical protein
MQLDASTAKGFAAAGHRSHGGNFSPLAVTIVGTGWYEGQHG